MPPTVGFHPAEDAMRRDKMPVQSLRNVLCRPADTNLVEGGIWDEVRLVMRMLTGFTRTTR